MNGQGFDSPGDQNKFIFFPANWTSWTLFILPLIFLFLIVYKLLSVQFFYSLFKDLVEKNKKIGPQINAIYVHNIHLFIVSNDMNIKIWTK